MNRPALDPMHLRIARAAVAMTAVALGVAFLISLATVRNAFPIGLLQILATAAMWSPLGLLMLFLVMQGSIGGREPVWLHRVGGDAWFLTLVLCSFVFDFRDSLRATTPWPLATSLRSAVMLEVVIVGLIMARLFQIRGKLGRTRPNVPG